MNSGNLAYDEFDIPQYGIVRATDLVLHNPSATGTAKLPELHRLINESLRLAD